MSNIFDNIIPLPNPDLKQKAERLIGFDDKFQRIYGNLKLILDTEGIKNWSREHHNVELPIVKNVIDRYPLIILAGDVGTGKTISAECIANEILRDLKKEGFFLKLSTRVRGQGIHGEMGNLVNNAFDELKEKAGKKRIAFLFIDEADAIATSRGTAQMHQEEKAAVNTLIQKIDGLRELKGRAVLFMSTNRLSYLDEAIIRRAAIILEFNRPTDSERSDLFKMYLDGLKFNSSQIKKLVSLTSPKANDNLGHTFSDITVNIFPEAISMAYPDKPLTFEMLCEAISRVKPSPEII